MPLVDIPQSQQQALEEAMAAANSHLAPLLASSRSKRGKGFTRAPDAACRFAVELPLADTSAAAVAQLAAAVLKLLPPASAPACHLVFAQPAAAAAAAAAGLRRPLSLQVACRAASLSGPLLLVSPGAADVALVEQLLDEVWAGPFVLVLNPSWQDANSGEYAQLVDSFQVAYSFLPISIKGLLGSKDGAVLRVFQRGGGPAGASWRILWEDRPGRFVQVGKTPTRPQQSDLELSFMNAAAAASPLTAAVKSVRGMFAKVGQAGQ